jgi:hypothetical protein
VSLKSGGQIQFGWNLTEVRGALYVELSKFICLSELRLG